MAEAVAEQREENRLQPDQPASWSDLSAIGVERFRFSPESVLSDPSDGSADRVAFDQLCVTRGFSYRDVIEISRERLPNYEERIKSFFAEHLHADDEIRSVVEFSVTL